VNANTSNTNTIIQGPVHDGNPSIRKVESFLLNFIELIFTLLLELSTDMEFT